MKHTVRIFMALSAMFISFSGHAVGSYGGYYNNSYAYSPNIQTTAPIHREFGTNDGLSFEGSFTFGLADKSFSLNSRRTPNSISPNIFFENTLHDTYTFHNLPANGITINATFDVDASFTGSNGARTRLHTILGAHDLSIGGTSSFDTDVYIKQIGLIGDIPAHYTQTFSFTILNNRPYELWARVFIDQSTSYGGSLDFDLNAHWSINIPQGIAYSTASGISVVPEPEQLMMLVSGLLLLACRFRKQ